MSDFLNFLKNELNQTIDEFKRITNTTETENGAYTYKSTLSNCLDLFYRSGGLRNSVSEDEIETLAENAYTENPDKAMKIFFYTRDIRGGLGERKVFRTIMKYMAEKHTESVRKNLIYFSEYGRWDDLVELYGKHSLDDDIIKIIKNQLDKDVEDMQNEKCISLLAKWLPSVNTSSYETRNTARSIAKALGYTERNYRKTLSSLRRYIDIVENRLREKDYTFEYSALPSRAMFCYRNAFLRNDNKRYSEYLENVSKGIEKINTSTLYPYDIVRSVLEKELDDEEITSLDTMWNSMKEVSGNENAIAVVDGSGSMYTDFCSPRPIDVALSLGIYLAEKNKGKFANHFITFSSSPRLVKIEGNNIAEKVDYCSQFNEVANTDIQAVFRLILETAIHNKLPQSEIPQTIYIISDMEFDYCARYGNQRCTNFEFAKKQFEKYGYKLPKVVFWNVASRNQQVPVTAHESNTVLVSGSSSSIFEMVQKDTANPLEFMNMVIESERYMPISA